eukprot:11133988-Prorocentrum_lima.AAC.1
MRKAPIHWSHDHQGKVGISGITRRNICCGTGRTGSIHIGGVGNIQFIHELQTWNNPRGA